MIEFETLVAGKVTAPLSAVVYLRHHDEKYIVVMAAGPGSMGWDIDRDTYIQLRTALRGYDQEDTDKAA